MPDPPYQQRTARRRVPWADHPSRRPLDDPADMLRRMLETDTRRREDYDAELAYQRREEWLRNQPAATERMEMIRRNQSRTPSPNEVRARVQQMDARRDALLKMQTAERTSLPENPFPQVMPAGLPENPYDQEDEEL